VRNAKYQHNQLLVLKRVDDSIITGPDAPASVLAASQHLRARWTWIYSQDFNCAGDPESISLVDSSDFTAVAAS